MISVLSHVRFAYFRRSQMIRDLARTNSLAPLRIAGPFPQGTTFALSSCGMETMPSYSTWEATMKSIAS
jgi:hypothetical protein